MKEIYDYRDGRGNGFSVEDRGDSGALISVSSLWGGCVDRSAITVLKSELPILAKALLPYLAADPRAVQGKTPVIVWCDEEDEAEMLHHHIAENFDAKDDGVVAVLPCSDSLSTGKRSSISTTRWPTRSAL